MLEDNAKFEVVEREIKDGDVAVIDFTGYVDGVAFEGGAAEEYPLEIGSHSFIDTFEDQLVGKKAGDEVDVNVTFPENYQAENLAGKPAVFKVVVKEVKEKVLPEFNDKFVADTTEFETVEEYKKDLTAHIQDMKNKQQDNEVEYVIREYLLNNTNVEIPESMVENEVNEDVERMRHALSHYGVTLEDYLAQTGSNIDDYLKNANERTLKMIKTRYVYRQLLAENNIDLTAEEIKDATKGISDRNEVLKIENELILAKLHKFLRENNTIEIIKE